MADSLNLQVSSAAACHNPADKTTEQSCSCQWPCHAFLPMYQYQRLQSKLRREECRNLLTDTALPVAAAFVKHPFLPNTNVVRVVQGNNIFQQSPRQHKHRFKCNGKPGLQLHGAQQSRMVAFSAPIRFSRPSIL